MNYRGFEIEKIEAIQTLAHESRVAGTKRPKTRKIGTQYIISLPDGGTKTVSTMKHAREYIDNYIGSELKGNPGKVYELKVPERIIYLATLINPVDHRLYNAVWDVDDHEVMIVTPSSSKDEIEVWGQGYLSSSDEPAEQTNCPRSHTPTGVAERGKGFGLLLYSGLALAAAYGSLVTYSIARQYGLPRMGDCISSMPDGRSRFASKWWEAQVQKGFAREVVGEDECDERELEETVDVSDAGIDEDYVYRQVDETGEVSNVHGDLSGTVYYEFCKRTPDAQILEAANVLASGMVIYANKEVFVEDSPELPRELPSVPVLLELDLSTLGDPRLLEVIMDDLREKYPDSEIQKIRRKWSYAEQIGLPGVTLGRTEPFTQLGRNPAHSRAWKEQFGHLTEPI